MYDQIAAERLLMMVNCMGIGVIENRKRLRGLLWDYCKECRREADLLFTVSEMGFMKRLRLYDTVSELDIFKFEKQLQDRKFITPEAARWGITTWLFALSSGKALAARGVLRDKPKRSKLPGTQVLLPRMGNISTGTAEQYETNGYARVTKNGKLYFVNPPDVSEPEQEKIIDM